MPEDEKKTAGELQYKASKDETRYDMLEVGHAMSEDVIDQIRICINNNYESMDTEEFCVVLLLVDDPLIKGLLRRKFYAWPFLPKPRPRQSVFLFSKKNDSLKRLWTLPDALTMATTSSMQYVAKEYQNMKNWADAFYEGFYKQNPSIFWDLIRKQSKTTLLSEHEFLQRNRGEVSEPEGDEISALFPETFDFSKVKAFKIREPKDPLTS